MIETWGWTPDQIDAVVRDISVFEYDSNIIIDGACSGYSWSYEYTDADGNVERDHHERPASNGIKVITASTGRCGFKLRCVSTKGPGHRLAAYAHPSTGKQRRLIYACWHVHRDVFQSLFEHNRDGKIVTPLARYEGYDGFRANYPGTAHTSRSMYGDYFGDLCECEHDA